MYIPNLNLSCAPSGSALYLSPGYLAGRGCPVLSLPSQPQPSITTSRRILAAVLCHQALNFQRPPTFPLLPPLSFDLSLQPTFQLTLRPPVSPSTALTPPSTSSEPPASMSRPPGGRPQPPKRTPLPSRPIGPAPKSKNVRPPIPLLPPPLPSFPPPSPSLTSKTQR